METHCKFRFGCDSFSSKSCRKMLFLAVFILQISLQLSHVFGDKPVEVSPRLQLTNSEDFLEPDWCSPKVLRACMKRASNDYWWNRRSKMYHQEASAAGIDPSFLVDEPQFVIRRESSTSLKLGLYRSGDSLT